MKTVADKQNKGEKGARDVGGELKVLMISTDRKIFEKNSAVRLRMVEYGTLVDELHIIVFTAASDHFKKESIAENVEIYPTNTLHKLLYVWNVIATVGAIIKRNKSASWLVTTQDPFETGLAGLVVSWWYRASLQVQIHTDFLSPYFKKNSLKNRVRVIIADKVIPKADCIRVVSHRISKSLKERYKLRSEPFLLPIFTDSERFITTSPSFDIHDRYSQFDFIVLMASRLEKEKNIPLALKAFKNICSKFPKAGLLIVGEGREETKIKKLSLKLKLSNNIVFEEWSDDIISYYKTADAFLNTSNYEGYGLSLIEAACAGCPIITTDVGIVGDVLTESGVLICPVGDSGCIERSIINMAENQGFREKLSKQAQNMVQRTLITHKEVYLQKYGESFEKCFK